MSMKARYLSGLVMLALLPGAVARADTGCVFDPAVAKMPTVLQTEQVRNYDWNEEDRRARGLLDDGSLFSVRYWACNHVGARVVLLIDESAGLGKPELRSRISAAAAFLPEEEARIVRAYVADIRDLKLQEYKRVTLPVAEYSEFSLGYGMVSESFVIEVMYYFD